MHQFLTVGCLTVAWVLTTAGSAEAQYGYISSISTSPNPFTDGQSVQIKVGASWAAYGSTDYIWAEEVYVEVWGDNGFQQAQSRQTFPTLSNQATFTFTDYPSAGATVNYTAELWVKYYNGEYNYYEWIGPEYGYTYAQYKPPSQPGVPPSSETTASGGWNTVSPYRTTHKWNQTLIGTENYGGMAVYEQDYPGWANDTCWFTTSRYAKEVKVTGGNWLVSNSNTWGPDSVGWTESRVSYYRAVNRAPCGTTFAQEMFINMPNGTFAYKINTLKMGFTTTRVYSERDNVRRERSW